MKRLVFALFSLLFAWGGLSASILPNQISGKSVIDGSQIRAGQSSKQGLVVVFLSAVCPCSNSHLGEIKNLAKEFQEFSFVGIHANSNEEIEMTSSYFKAANLPFPVIRDSNAKIADEFRALRTPHAFIILPDGRVAYRGGVSSTSDFNDGADRKYLREALTDLTMGRKVGTPEGRTLGCVITRGGSHVW